MIKPFKGFGIIKINCTKYNAIVEIIQQLNSWWSNEQSLKDVWTEFFIQKSSYGIFQLEFLFEKETKDYRIICRYFTLIFWIKLYIAQKNIFHEFYQNLFYLQTIHIVVRYKYRMNYLFKHLNMEIKSNKIIISCNSKRIDYTFLLQFSCTFSIQLLFFDIRYQICTKKAAKNWQTFVMTLIPIDHQVGTNFHQFFAAF